jgi:hypothetical protein
MFRITETQAYVMMTCVTCSVFLNPPSLQWLSLYPPLMTYLYIVFMMFLIIFRINSDYLPKLHNLIFPEYLRGTNS